eukprot:TRINITY_DN550_c3_g1_i1.p1 TRINITY_DN550_c3_g1~~TRINITY_DN550_c3_g1_i1.p1  ORF type:complete len:754 (+),score=323.05 TRINITY_DN550_c3_g1_i1:199-2262(+)
MALLGAGMGAAALHQLAQAEEKRPRELPLIALEEVAKHKSADSVWVTYEGVVYDVTPFVNNHPGGRDLLLTAAGMDLHHFFTNYTVHLRTEKAQNYLNSMAIGRLSPEDAAKAQAASTADAHVESRMRTLGNARWRLMAVVALMPWFLTLRCFLRVLAFVIPPLAAGFARCLPISIPGVGDAGKLPAVDPKTGKQTRVAVIGGGIAGSGCAYALSKAGFDVTLYEARAHLSGNARTFDWENVDGKMCRSCVSVTAWPAHLYKNYVALLKEIDVKTAPQHLSWVLNSKVPGHEGILWAADPDPQNSSLRQHFEKDFSRYGMAVKLVDFVTKTMTLSWGYDQSMYSLQAGLGPLNPFATLPLHHISRIFGVSREWWDIVFTPHYTASFLTDKLDNMVAVTGPLIESQIPLNPVEGYNTAPNPRRLTTCETWADAGVGIQEVFEKLTRNVKVFVNTRVLKVFRDEKTGTITLSDEYGGGGEFDRVVFACPCNAVGNIHEEHNWIEGAILGSPEYADDHHPSTGHMHAIMHNDASIIPEDMREAVLERGSNYVEVTKKADGTLNIENTYNFGVQTPAAVGLPLDKKPPMLITHALGEGRTIDPEKIVGTGNHARAHPLYSGWNLASLLSLRLAQGRNGIYYCANYTTPGNCHDMSLASGLVVAQAIGAPYPFEHIAGAKSDFNMLRTLMGV